MGVEVEEKRREKGEGELGREEGCERGKVNARGEESRNPLGPGGPE